MKLSVLIPVYNEEHTLEEVVRRVCDFQIPKEIILVDDGSEDQSRKILTRLQEENARATDPLNQIKVFFQPVNQGKGAALKTGFQHAKGNVVIVQDADLEYDPTDFHRLIQPILDNQADIVYGSGRISEYRTKFYPTYVTDELPVEWRAAAAICAVLLLFGPTAERTRALSDARKAR